MIEKTKPLLKIVLASIIFGVFAITSTAQGVITPHSIKAKRAPFRVVDVKSLREKDKTARLKYRNAREQYLKEVNFYKSARSQFLSAREKYRKFKTPQNKNLYQQRARAFLERTIEVLIKKLQALEIWISNKRALPEREREAIKNKIEEDINWLASKKEKIATSNIQQIKEMAKEIRRYWREHRLKMKRIIARILAARVDYIINRAEAISERIAQRISKLKEKGKDTSQLEAWLEDFNEKISLARQKYEKAKEEYQQIRESAGENFTNELKQANELFKRANQFIREANQYLKKAHMILVKIVREMRKMGEVNTKSQTESPSQQ